MARSLASPLSGLVAIAAASSSLVACVDTGNETIVILQNQAPSTGCAVGASVEDVYRPAGRIEATTSEGYIFTPVAKNYATAIVGEEQRRIAFVRGARVDIEFLDADVISAEQAQQLADAGLTRFEVPFAAMIEPQGTTSMIFEIVPEDLITGTIAPLLEPGDELLLRANVKLFGRIGDDDFESESFPYPVTVCDECLIVNLGPCALLSEDFTPTATGGVCNPVQDDAVQCCENGTELICPAVGTMAPMN